MEFTVFGSSGFIGGHVVRLLKEEGHCVYTPSRTDLTISGKHLGRVIYCIGLTGDFRSRLFDTIEANVNIMAHLIRSNDFDGWLYLSSTRVYGMREQEVAANEDEPIRVRPSADAVYDTSKLLGESLVLGIGRPGMSVARISNIVGDGMNTSTFLGSILRKAELGEPINIQEHRKSAKDYLGVDDLAKSLIEISKRGTLPIYNVASGSSTSHEQVADAIREVFGTAVVFKENGQLRRFPQIDISRFSTEFPQIRPRTGLDAIKQLIGSKRK